MAVLKIDVISIIGRMADLDEVTALCGKSGAFHPDNALSFYSDTSDFSPLNEENPYAEPLQQLNGILSDPSEAPGLIPYSKEDQPTMSPEEMRNFARYISGEYADLQRQLAKTEENIKAYSEQIDEISHFVGLDVNLDEVHACEYIKVRFGSLPKESFEKLNAYTQNPYVVFFPSSNDDSYYWGVYFAPISEVSEVDRIFSSLYFERTRLAEMTGTPESALEDYRRKLADEKALHKSIEAKIEDLLKTNQKTFQTVYWWMTEQSVYFGIRRYAARYNGNFILTGWIPKEKEQEFTKALDQVESIEYSVEGAEEQLEHSPPIKLKNRKLFSPFEFYVDMYGLPAYDEVDPTPFVSLTYMILFGIMFADLGQGLVVSLIGWLMWQKKKMPLGRILVPCGISAAVFGTLFGSVFGFEHALDPLYINLLGMKSKPIEVMEPTTTTGIIYSAVGIGIFLVMCAMLINIYSSLKRKHYADGLFGPSGIAGFIFYTSLIFGFGGQALFNWKIVTPAYVICLIIVPILAMFFREVLGKLVERSPDWKPKSWGDFIMQNFFEVFEFLLSYATNTMSFLRVGAFVLVHAGMMMVVFTLAEMSSGIGYVLVLIIGNAFVTALEGLLVGIQVLRLEFYEMFSRFFEGSGRPFKPIVVHAEQ